VCGNYLDPREAIIDQRAQPRAEASAWDGDPPFDGRGAIRFDEAPGSIFICAKSFAADDDRDCDHAPQQACVAIAIAARRSSCGPNGC